MRRRRILMWPLAVAVLACTAFLAIRVNPAGIIRPCVFRAVTGIPCPACGTVHALRELGAARVLPALQSNPLAAAVALLSGASALAAVIVIPWAHRLRPSRRIPRRTIFRIAAGLVILNWAYLIISVLR